MVNCNFIQFMDYFLWNRDYIERDPAVCEYKHVLKTTFFFLYILKIMVKSQFKMGYGLNCCFLLV